MLIAKIKSVYHFFRKYIWVWYYRKDAVNHRESDDTSEKKIVVVSHSAVRSGAPLLALHLIKALQERGFETTTFLMEPGSMTGDFFKEAVTDWGFGRRHLNRAFRQLKAKGFDYCICNSAMSGDAAKAAKEAGMTVLSLIHEMPRVLEEMDGKGRARKALRYSDKLIFPSSVVKERFFNFLDVDASEKSLVRPQGIYHTPSVIWSREDARNRIRDEIGIDPDKPIVINAATVSERKGYDLFLELSQMRSDIQFIWLAAEKNRYYQDCRSRIRTGDNYFETGFLTDVDLLYAFYTAADLLVMTSREEPMASIVMEAFLAGTPVAAYDHCGGAVDVITEGQTGFLAGAVTAESMKEKLDLYFGMSIRQREEMREYCRQMATDMKFENYVSFLLDQFR